ncbi:MAG: class I SAM-dependent methyltransferase [Betaproteobacteria bacterium]|nr:class I SAM-dependent methyltransferase [Betaproteobacteria bacterium]
MFSIPRIAIQSIAIALFAAGVALAQPANEYKPSVGQSGKDVVWVPTPEELVERMLTMAHVTANDFVIDLGSGDGRTVIAAAKRGANALGIEYNPDMVTLSTRAAQREGVSAKAKFVKADIFESDFSKATVITMYLLPGLNLKLRPKLLEMRPGTRLVSHQFTMDDWQPDETSYFDFRPGYLWIVPAKTQGRWRIDAPGFPGLEASFEQTFQRVKGEIELGNNIRVGLREARLWGDQISFTAVDAKGVMREFTGKVTGDRMAGTVKTGSETGQWSAVKK